MTAPCVNPPEIDNGHISHINSFEALRFDTAAAAAGWKHGEKIEYKCYRHYALYDEYEVICDNSVWRGVTSNSVFPKCKYSMATESKCTHYFCYPI